MAQALYCSVLCSRCDSSPASGAQLAEGTKTAQWLVCTDLEASQAAKDGPSLRLWLSCCFMGLLKQGVCLDVYIYIYRGREREREHTRSLFRGIWGLFVSQLLSFGCSVSIGFKLDRHPMSPSDTWVLTDQGNCYQRGNDIPFDHYFSPRPQGASLLTSCSVL